MRKEEQMEDRRRKRSRRMRRRKRRGGDRVKLKLNTVVTEHIPRLGISLSPI